MILTIRLSMEPQESPHLDDAPTVVRRLLAQGYDEIDLTGLARFRARLRDGRLTDTMALRSDDDAEFLVEGYHHLMDGSKGALSRHQVYLVDGCFEISALFLADHVRVRMGEYRHAFDLAGDEGVRVSRAQYVALWASIAAGLRREGHARAGERT